MNFSEIVQPGLYYSAASFREGRVICYKFSVWLLKILLYIQFPNGKPLCKPSVNGVESVV